MSSRFLALALLPLGLFLGACATTGTGLMQQVGGDASCRSTLRACLKGGPGMINNIRMQGLREVFATGVFESNPDPSKCDIAFDFPATFSDRTIVSSAYNGQVLARYDANSYQMNARAACTDFSDENGEKFKSIPGDAVLARRPGRPAPAAPSSGLSSADIERIAKAVKGGDAAAPAAAPAASYPASPSPRFSAAERPDDLAIVVGIETYSDIASKAPYAERDADAFKAHVRALGVPERNIVLLKGAKAGKASLEKNLEQWLPRMAKADSRVYFYFSGHGAPDVKTGQAYLVPWDGDPNFLESTGYPVAKLYKKLGELPARQVLVAMDSCFSGAGGRSVLASGARPLVAKIDTGAAPATVTVLAASAANEISGSLDDKGHGAFTYFLLEGMNAGKSTPKALAEYLTPRVQDEARRLNRDQTPQLQGDGAWPLR
ncbi:MAG: caspase family protein [Elusimicrobia bacterium]|nr:caspase family protein [Elusimicrobiota bacterium]